MPFSSARGSSRDIQGALAEESSQLRGALFSAGKGKSPPLVGCVCGPVLGEGPSKFGEQIDL